MSIIDANEIRDNIEDLTNNKEVQNFVRSLTNNQIEDYFSGFVDFDGISRIRNDAYEEGLLALERQYEN